MKRIKKILGMMLCSVVIIGSGNLALVKAHAQDYVSNQPINTRSTSDTTSHNELWSTGISIRLRNKAFPCYKTSWNLDLICTKDERLMLKGCTNISKDYTFDDEYIWGYQRDGKPYVITRFRGLNNVDAGCALAKAKDLFNEANIRVGDTIFMYGNKSDNSFKFNFKCKPNSNFPTSIISSQNGNNYSNGYQSVNRFEIGFKVVRDGLNEVKFEHHNI